MIFVSDAILRRSCARFGPEDATGAGVDEDRGGRADVDVRRLRGAAFRRGGAVGAPAARVLAAGVDVAAPSSASAPPDDAAGFAAARRPNQTPAPAAASTTSTTSERPSRCGSGVCGAAVRPASERLTARSDAIAGSGGPEARS